MRAHTKSCLDAAQAYVPCICGADDANAEEEALGGYEEATPLEKEEYDRMASSNT